MIRKGRKIDSQIVLDWFNVTYKSLFLGIFIVIIVISIAIFSYYFYLSQASPRAESKREIEKAESLYHDAVVYAQGEKLEELRDTAKDNLNQALDEYDRKNYTDAKIAAIRSQNLSQKIIDIAREESTTSSEVRFYKIEGDVKVKRAGSFIWEAATPRTLLRYGDQIKTSSKASAQIIYFDGTITTIHQGSLLEIREIYEDPRTKVQKVHEKLNFGALLASTQKKRTEGSFHEVSTETSKAKSDKEAEFKVAYDKDRGESSIDLYKGSLEVLTSAERMNLSESERISVAKNGRISEKKNIPYPPEIISPADQKIFVYTKYKEATTDLIWEKTPICKKYHLMISNLPLFSNTIVNKKDLKTNYVELPGLTPASYYWKVSCYNDEGVEGRASETRKFRIVSSQFRDKNDTIPPKIEISDFLQTGPLVIVSGKTEPGANLWVDSERVDVYDDGTFYAVVKLRKEGASDIHIMAQDPSGNETKVKRRAYIDSY
jgi:hypothetical protein